MKSLTLVVISIWLSACSSGSTTTPPVATPAPTASPSPTPDPAIPVHSKCKTIIFNFDGGVNAGITKTFVLIDLRADGSFANTGSGGNGNIGNSAKTGASCCRAPADPVISGVVADNSGHTLGVYALDSEGYLIGTGPLILYRLDAVTRENCTEVFP